MKGDFSRDTFDPQEHYTRVLMQQGRIQTDADFNEQSATERYLAERATRDIIGAHGGPADDLGFGIATVGRDLWIEAGRYYVDGVAVETGPGQLRYEDQPNGAADWSRLLNEMKATDALVYLDVWEREVTCLEDPALRDVALQVDTTMRAQTVWSVRAAAVAKPLAAVDELAEWRALSRGERCEMAARVGHEDDVDALGYLGPENRFYRVEIHHGSSTGAATFKWSRDNGSVVAAVEVIDGATFRIRDVPAPEQSDAFVPGAWVELTDDATERQGGPGLLREIEAVDHESLGVKVRGAIATSERASQLKMRKWDGASANGLRLVCDQWLELEAGIEVRFDVARCESGDYWQIPARLATHEVEWPRSDREPRLLPRRGIYHRYAPLALLRSGRDGSWKVAQDCRRVFRALAQPVSNSPHPGLRRDASALHDRGDVDDFDADTRG